MIEHETWRIRLKALADKFGRGGIRVIADAIGKSPTYVSRMLSDPSTSQHRVVSHETCYLLTKAFPGWLDNQYQRKQSVDEDKHRIESSVPVYEVNLKTKRQRSIDALLETVKKINDDGIERLLERADALSESHPALAKQTLK